MISRNVRRLLLPASLLIFGWSAPLALAGAKNAAGTNWSNAANWSPTGVPGTGDHIIINESATEISGGALSGTTRRTYRFNSDTTLEVQDIQILSLGTGREVALSCLTLVVRVSSSSTEVGDQLFH